ncbi:MAG: PASTA domain-containing protein [Actinomycetota bacterium]|nr:PASTA domain-containing protein [Actinomycetota bacterium]
MTVTWTDDGIGRVLDARYRLVALIGAGASARVYLADDLRLRRQVAVKILHPTLAHDEVFLRRFEQEARAAAAFNHPHVVAVHDWGETEVGPYLVTEYLAGGSLQALLATGALLSGSQAVKVGLEAASGLAAAHRRGMVHRDVKPANLLFGAGSRLRVADFGLVQALSETSLTAPDGVVIGTVKYSAPERAHAGTADGRTDVYSLLVTLVEAVTGSVPLAAGSSTDIMTTRAEHPIVVPEQFGAAREILTRAGLVDIEARPTAEQLMHELVHSTEFFDAPARLPLAGAIQTGTPTPVFDDASVEEMPTELASTQHAADQPPSPPEATPPRRSGHPARWILAALVILGAGAVGAGFMVSSVEPVQVVTTELNELRGLSIDEVRDVAFANGWTLDEDQVRSDSLEVGSVIRQSPGAGSRLSAGASVSVDVVVGPLLKMAPWVVGLDADDAVLRLEARGFAVGARDPRFDEIVPAGVVIDSLVSGTSVAGGVLMEPGTGFDLVVSEGPVPRTVPELVGASIGDAQARVAAVGLALVETDREFSEDVEVGFVISQDIASGQQTSRGTTVTVVVSKGQDRRVVPEVEGLTIDEATAALESVGLFRSGVSGGGDIVENSDPRPGTLLKPGEGVLLFAPR